MDDPVSVLPPLCLTAAAKDEQLRNARMLGMRIRRTTSVMMMKEEDDAADEGMYVYS